MRRGLSLLLSVALLGLSWPAAAVERVAEIRTVPAAAVLAPSALLARPALALPGGGLGAPTTLAIPALGASAALPADTAPAAAAPASTPSTRAFPAGVVSAAGVAQTSPAGVENRDNEIARFPRSARGGVAFAARPPAAQAPDGAARSKAALPQAAAASSAQAADGRVFDGSGPRAPAVAAPVALLGGAAVLGPAAAHLPHLSLAALHASAPMLSAAGYDFANGLAVAFPLPEAYAALRRGHAHGFPLGRAVLGAVGQLALGLINAVVLGKTSWGIMQTLVGLGMVAPYVIGRVLERRGGGLKPYAPAEGARGLREFAHRLRRDQALWATFGVGASLLAVSTALYFAAAAVVPAVLGAFLSAHAISNLLLWIQIGKAFLFMGVFAPDAVALARGRPTHGFSFWFTAVYLASVAAYTIWGFSAAAMAAAGPIRDQYLVLAVRNLLESLASALSLIAIWRAARRSRKG